MDLSDASPAGGSGEGVRHRQMWAPIRQRPAPRRERTVRPRRTEAISTSTSPSIAAATAELHQVDTTRVGTSRGHVGAHLGGDRPR